MESNNRSTNTKKFKQIVAKFISIIMLATIIASSISEVVFAANQYGYIIIEYINASTGQHIKTTKTNPLPLTTLRKGIMTATYKLSQNDTTVAGYDFVAKANGYESSYVTIDGNTQKIVDITTPIYVITGDNNTVSNPIDIKLYYLPSSNKLELDVASIYNYVGGVPQPAIGYPATFNSTYGVTVNAIYEAYSYNAPIGTYTDYTLYYIDASGNRTNMKGKGESVANGNISIPPVSTSVKRVELRYFYSCAPQSSVSFTVVDNFMYTNGKPATLSDGRTYFGRTDMAAIDVTKNRDITVSSPSALSKEGAGMIYLPGSSIPSELKLGKIVYQSGPGTLNTALDKNYEIASKNDPSGWSGEDYTAKFTINPFRYKQYIHYFWIVGDDPSEQFLKIEYVDETGKTIQPSITRSKIADSSGLAVYNVTPAEMKVTDASYDFVSGTYMDNGTIKSLSSNTSNVNVTLNRNYTKETPAIMTLVFRQKPNTENITMGKLKAEPDDQVITGTNIGMPVTLTTSAAIPTSEFPKWENIILDAESKGMNFEVTLKYTRTSADVGGGLIMNNNPETYTLTPSELKDFLYDRRTFTASDDTSGISTSGKTKITLNYSVEIGIKLGLKTYKAVVSDTASFIIKPPKIGFTSRPEAYAELKNYGGGSNLTGTLKEDFDAMAGVPSTEQLYFAAGGSEFIVDVSVEYVQDEVSKRSYESIYSGTDCEFKSNDTAKSKTVPSPTGATSSTLTVDPHTGGTITASWSYTVTNKSVASDLTGYRAGSAGSPCAGSGFDAGNPGNITWTDSWEATVYNNAVTNAKAWQTQLNAFILSHTADSDDKTRNWNAWNASLTGNTWGDSITASQWPSYTKTTGQYGYVSGYVAGLGHYSGDASNTHQHGTFVEATKTTVTKTADKTFTITVTATVPPHVICGPCCSHVLPEIHDTWAQTWKYDSMKITDVHVWKIDQAAVNGMTSIINTDIVGANIVNGNPNIFYNIALKNDANFTSQDGKGGATGTSSAGRVRYSLNPEQHDEVIYNNGTRTNKCDGLSKTYAGNVIAAGGGGHAETYAKGFIYNGFKPASTNTGAANNIGQVNYPIDTDGFLQSKTDSVDQATTEYAKFLTQRTAKVTPTMITDFLILQTSSGDQAVLYFHKTSTATPVNAESKLPELNVIKEDMWNNNPNSAANWTEDHINVGSYNGKYATPPSKFKWTTKGNAPLTFYDADPAGTIIRPSRPSGSLMLYKGGLNNILGNANQAYKTGEAEVFWSNNLHWSETSGSTANAPYSTNLTTGPITGFNFGTTGYTMKAPYSKEHTKINDIIIHDPVSLRDFSLVSLPQNMDQRTEKPAGGAADLINDNNNNQVCPREPSLCEFRVLNCTFFQDTVLANFDFDTLDSLGNPVNKTTGNSLVLPTGFTKSGGQLSAKGTRIAIPFSELTLQYQSSLHLKVEGDITMSPPTGNGSMIFSFNQYALYVPPGQSYATLYTGNDWERKITIPIADGVKHRIVIDFSFNSVDSCRVTVDGVEGYQRINASSEINNTIVGSNFYIGSWGSNNNYPANFMLDNFKITRLAGTTTHNEDCYKLTMTHPAGLNSHVHTADCIHSKGLTAGETGSKQFNFNGNFETFKAPVDGVYTLEVWGAQGGSPYHATAAGYTCNSLPLNSGGYQNNVICHHDHDFPQDYTTYYYANCTPNCHWITQTTYTTHVHNSNCGYSSGSSTTAVGGLGGYSKGQISLKKDEVLYIYVGGQGAADSSGSTANGGWNGGGKGQYYSGGGGGATDIRKGGQSLTNRIIVAGGGGGGQLVTGTSYKADGGSGGGTTGGNGANHNYWSNSYVTTGGTQSAGGTGNCNNNNGAAGNGGNANGNYLGGGGGGYFGGAAGTFQGHSGGGGSGYTGTLESASMQPGTQTGNGMAKISWVENSYHTSGVEWFVQEVKAGRLTEQQMRDILGPAYESIMANSYGPVIHTWDNWSTTEMYGFKEVQQSSLSTNNGKLVMTSTGTDPYFEVQVDFDAPGISKISVTLDNRTASTSAQLYWKADDNTAYNNTRMVSATLEPNTDNQTINFILRDNLEWRGIIKSLRFDLATTTGTINVSSIKIYGEGEVKTTGSATIGTVVWESGNPGAYTYNATSGKYILQLWGAQGGYGGDGNYINTSWNPGEGGYATGEITLNSTQVINIYVGGQGQGVAGPYYSSNGVITGGFNGGGNAYHDGGEFGGGGGGATDIRIGGTSVSNRIIVAGGGGGTGEDGEIGGNGGGLTSTGDYSSNYTANQLAGGTRSIGANGASYNTTTESGGGGGGGYYGGGGGEGSGSGGGSGYIGGVQNGQTIAGDSTMPNPAGGTMIGKTGNGYAKILSTFTPVRIVKDNYRDTLGYKGDWSLAKYTLGNIGITRQLAAYTNQIPYNPGQGQGYNVSDVLVSKKYIYVVHMNLNYVSMYNKNNDGTLGTLVSSKSWYDNDSTINTICRNNSSVPSGFAVYTDTNGVDKLIGWSMDTATIYEWTINNNTISNRTSYTAPTNLGSFSRGGWDGNNSIYFYNRSTQKLYEHNLDTRQTSEIVTLINGNTYINSSWTGSGLLVDEVNKEVYATTGSNDSAGYISAWSLTTGDFIGRCNSTASLTAAGITPIIGTNGAIQLNPVHRNVAYYFANYYNDLRAIEIVLNKPAPFSGTTDSGGTPTPVIDGQVTDYTYTGSTQQITLPKGTYKLETWGAEGGTSGGTSGGRGGYSTGTLTLTQDTTLFVNVGGKGRVPTGGFNGGGAGGNAGSNQGGGGGGASDIRTSQTDLNSRLIVAGGGGGAGGDGQGGSYSGVTPGTGGVPGVGGGTSGTNGAKGTSHDLSSGFGGTSGTASSGGNGGLPNYASSVPTNDGTYYPAGGGGGGGGYYGGGGGSGATREGTSSYPGQSGGNGTLGTGGTGGNAASSGSGYHSGSGGGGGGGSGYVGGVTDGSTVAGNSTMPNPNGGTMTGRAGDGLVRITALSIGTPTSGQVFEHPFKGSMEQRLLPKGTYKFEVWGAQGNGPPSGGRGGYSVGIVTLNEDTIAYISVGGTKGFNGGGVKSTTSANGGGGTDIRIGGNNLQNRVIVAGGGGGGGGYGNSSGTNMSFPGGDGGGLTGGNGNVGPMGGGQSSGGSGNVPGSLGQGGAGDSGGGGGYYGGGGGIDWTGTQEGGRYSAGGGSGYIGGVGSGMGVTAQTISGNSTMPAPNGGTQTGQLGDGYARVTALVVEGAKPKLSLSASDIAEYWESIPNNLPDGTRNPIWGCDFTPNVHVHDSSCRLTNTLICTEPHHKGMHYDVSNKVCWQPCNNDENHKHFKPIVTTPTGTFTPGNFVNIDYPFQIYFPNIGDFNEGQPYGLGGLTTQKGLGFTDSMDTTKWTRLKRVRFQYNVIYDNKLYTAGEWILLGDRGTYTGNPGESYDETKWTNYGTSLYNGISKQYYDFYCVLANAEAKGATIEGEVEAVNSFGGNDNITNVSNRNRTASFNSLHGGFKTTFSDVVGRIGNLVLSDTGDYRFSNFFKTPYENNTIPTPTIYGVTNGLQTVGTATSTGTKITTSSVSSGAHVNNILVTQGFYRIDISGTALNNGHLKVVTTPVSGSPADWSGSQYVKSISITSSKMSYYLTVPANNMIDIAWLADNAIEMSVDNISITRMGDNPETWIVDGVVRDIDPGNQNYYMTWSKDIRGMDVSGTTNYVNTYNTRNWMDANKVQLPLSAEKNNISILKDEPLRVGYPLYFDITTLGDYWKDDSSKIQVVPYYYALDINTKQIIPVDAYINNNNSFKPVNINGLVTPTWDGTGVHNYVVNLDWLGENLRRNYTDLEKMQTDFIRDFYAVTVENNGVSAQRQPKIPTGSNYVLGTAQFLTADGRARTYIGGETTYGNLKNLGGSNTISTDGNGRKYNAEGKISNYLWWQGAQRWHLKIGLPSSTVFVRSGSQPNSSTVKEFVNPNYVILCTADIRVIGDVYVLKYQHDTDNGSINILKEDGNSTGPIILPNNIPPVIAVYSAAKTSAVDVDIIGVH